MDIQQRRPQRGGEQPFDQRLLLFALVATSVLLLTNRSAPPVAEPADGAAAGASNEAPADADAPAKDQPAAATGVEGLEALPAARPERVAFGSVDPDGAYRMLLTVDNVGAGVERAELSSENYRDLDDRSGYLGRLAPTDAPGGRGAVVNVVGPGTPAERAGIAVGDIITSAELPKRDAASVANAADLVAVLDASRPRQTLRLKLRRGEKPVDVEVKLARQPLGLLRPEAENVLLHTPELPEGYESAPSFLVRLHSVDGRRGDDPAIAGANRLLVESPWTIDDRSPDALRLRMRLPDLGLEVVKRYTVPTTPEADRDDHSYASYHFDVAVEVRNLGAETRAVSYELTGPNGLPIEGFWYAQKIGCGDGSFFGDWGSFGLRDVVVRFANDRLTQYAAGSVADGDVRPMGQGRPLAYAGIDAQYFASVVIPQKESLAAVTVAEVRPELATTPLDARAQPRWQNPSFTLVREPATLGAAGGESAAVSDSYRVFAGPKLPELLQRYAPNDDPNHTLADVPYYGWFGWAAKPMLWLLHTFYAVVGNYGLAIVLLTVCVRGAMFPISRQSAINMQKMQTLKPELDRITERYADDAQKRAQAQQDLFRKHNYNPAAGCLPVFLQLPIFMGLYRALAVDVELRQAPLISDAVRFCSNLAAPDMLWDWSSYTPLWVDNGLGMFGFGPFFNLLPLATCGLFLVQQQMFMPEPTNDQMRLQQQMMKYMMIFMGLMFFKVPSGLCIYFIASSLWGIAERQMLPKPPAVAAGATPLAPVSKAPSGASDAAALRDRAKKARVKKKRK